MDLAWLKVLIAPVLILVSIWLGNRIGVWRKAKVTGEEIASIRSVLAAALGFLTFMLAMTYQMASTRFQNRKESFLDHVNAIRAAHMQVELLKDPYQANCRKLIAAYVDFLVLLPSERGGREQMDIGRTKQILDSLWMQAKTMARENPGSGSSFINTVINLRQLFTMRVAVGLYSSIPSAIMLALYVIAFFTMLLVGFEFGTSGQISLIATLVLVIVFSTAMWLIFDLDNPEEGTIKVNQRPMLELQREIRNQS